MSAKKRQVETEARIAMQSHKNVSCHINNKSFLNRNSERCQQQLNGIQVCNIILTFYTKRDLILVN